MKAHAVPVAMLGAITAYVGLYYLWLFLRRRGQVDLYFALTCLAMTAYDAFSVLLYQADTLVEGARMQRLQITSILLLAPAFSLFVTAYTHYRPPRFYKPALFLFALGSLFFLVEPFGIGVTDIPATKHVRSPFGTVVYREVEYGPLLDVFQISIPLVAVQVFVATRSALRSTASPEGDRPSLDGAPIAATERGVVPLLVAAGLLLVGVTHDALVAKWVFPSVYVSEYSFFGIVVLMSWSLSNEVLEASTTQKSLRSAQSRIVTILDAIQDAVITADLAGRVMHLNPAAEKMLATRLVEALGKPVSNFVELTAPDTQLLVDDPIRYALGRAANPYGRLPRLVTRDGSDRRVDLGGAPLVDGDEHVQGAVIVLRDLTLQHNALESLQHAKQMESTGQLAGGLAHDLNNLLTPILSYVDLVHRQVGPGTKAATFLEHALEAAQRAAGLTRQLLALSRKQVLDVQAVSLNSFVESMLPILARIVPDEIEVALDLDDRVEQVQIDPGQFEQVLLNLVTNARDAMPAGGRVVVSTQRLAESVVCLGVTDHGAGVPKEMQERIFEPFFTTKPRGKGTGLGLASVRGIVEQHGGTVYVDSEVGAGTTVDVILPTYTGGEALRATRARAADFARGTERVLVVEDDAAVRTLIHDALVQLGYRVRSAENMSQALLAAQSEALDLLVTDVVLPGTDGPKVYRAIRELHDVPCLYITGHADNRLGERGFLADGTEVLRKPFKVSELAEKVRRVLERSRSDRPPESASPGRSPLEPPRPVASSAAAQAADFLPSKKSPSSN